MSPFSSRRRQRLARFLSFVVLAVVLGAGIATFANSAVGSRDTEQAAGGDGAGAALAIESADIPWPAEGGAAIAVGDGEVLTHADDPHAMASVTKLLTAPMVPEEKPPAAGEAAPVSRFVARWTDSY